jgi:hypothetical protein
MLFLQVFPSLIDGNEVLTLKTILRPHLKVLELSFNFSRAVVGSYHPAGDYKSGFTIQSFEIFFQPPTKVVLDRHRYPLPCTLYFIEKCALVPE